MPVMERLPPRRERHSGAMQFTDSARSHALLSYNCGNSRRRRTTHEIAATVGSAGRHGSYGQQSARSRRDGLTTKLHLISGWQPVLAQEYVQFSTNCNVARGCSAIILPVNNFSSSCFHPNLAENQLAGMNLGRYSFVGDT